MKKKNDFYPCIYQSAITLSQIEYKSTNQKKSLYKSKTHQATFALQPFYISTHIFFC